MRNRLKMILLVLLLETLPVFAAQEEQDQEIIEDLDLIMDFQLMDNLDLAEHYDILYATAPAEAGIDDSRGEINEDN